MIPELEKRYVEKLADFLREDTTEHQFIYDD